MAFEPLRTDYKDAVWAGLRKYLMLKNEDDTVSLKDVTQYTVYDDAFFGAEDANRINAAINAIMASVEKGTDLYEAFTAFFENQKKAFTAEADKQNEDFGKYLDGLEQTADADIAKMKDDYTAEIKNFENTQEAVYNTWFDHIKDQLSDDAAGNLQAQIDAQNETISTKISEGTKCIAQANTSPILDSTDGYIYELKIYGMSRQAATPTPENPQKICGIEYATVIVSEAGYNGYESSKRKAVKLSETLNAVPVADGGNITIDGQQYIADCVDVESGKLLQRVLTQRIRSSDVTTGYTRANGDYYATVMSGADVIYPILPADNDVAGACLCSICSAMSANDRYNSELSGISIRQDGSIELCIAGIKNETDFKNYLSNNEVTMAFAIKDQIEINLSSEKVQKLKNLVTYAAGTQVSVVATTKDERYGAFELKYFASTKGGEAAAYADAKLRDLAETVETNNNNTTTKIANMQTTLKDLLPNSKTVTIGSVTAADSATISGSAKKITLLVKKVTATATTGAAIYQYINLPTTEDGVTAPKLSALTGTLSTSHGTIAVSGSDILLKSVKGFSITAIIDYKNY